MNPAGQKVRCTKCLKVWFAKPETEDLPPVEIGAEVMPPRPEPTPESFDMPDAFDAASIPDTLPESKAEKMPSSLKQAIDQGAIDADTAGMGAGKFGFFVFLLLVFSTIIGLYFLRGPILHHVPVMAALYDKAGLGVPVAGEGLKLSELTATQKAVMLDIKAKLSNISHAEMKYPAMKVIMRGPYGASIKEWNVPQDGAVLAPGESVPIVLSFTDAPTDGASVELKVSAE